MRHLAFHLALAEGSGNRALIDVIGPLIRVTFDLTMTAQLRASAPIWDEYADHAGLLERIAAGDVEGARPGHERAPGCCNESDRLNAAADANSDQRGLLRKSPVRSASATGNI